MSFIGHFGKRHSDSSVHLIWYFASLNHWQLWLMKPLLVHINDIYIYIYIHTHIRQSVKDCLTKTSWHGNTFCITGLFWGIYWSLANASQFGSFMLSIGVFPLASMHKLLHKWSSSQWFGTPWRSVMHWRDHLTKACHCCSTQSAVDWFFK